MDDEVNDHLRRVLTCAKCGRKSLTLTQDPMAWLGWGFYCDEAGVEKELCPDCRLEDE